MTARATWPARSRPSRSWTRVKTARNLAGVWSKPEVERVLVDEAAAALARVGGLDAQAAFELGWARGRLFEGTGDYEGALADLDAKGFLECVLRNEKINQVAGRIMSFAGLRYYQLTTDAGRASQSASVDSPTTVRAVDRS